MGELSTSVPGAPFFTKTDNHTMKKRRVAKSSKTLFSILEVSECLSCGYALKQNLRFWTQPPHFFDEAAKNIFNKKCPSRVQLSAYNQQISVNFTFYLI